MDGHALPSPKTTMADRRYSTARWQRLRKAVLAHYGHVCQIQGPRCTGYATTVHHQIPSSQAPELFWEPANLAAACGACNYGGGARIQADNRRRRTAQLEQFIIEQQQEIARLVERLAYYEDGGRLERQRAEPRIY
jgi:5-methylcytosine-specific restriction endonuclease McrA